MRREITAAVFRTFSDTSQYVNTQCILELIGYFRGTETLHFVASLAINTYESYEYIQQQEEEGVIWAKIFQTYIPKLS